MEMNLVIIDALNLIRRIYAVQERQFNPASVAPGQTIDVNGVSVPPVVANTVNALESAIRKIINLKRPTHMVAVFDGIRQSWRHEIFPEYKAKRPPMPEQLAEHFSTIKQAFINQDIPLVEPDNHEADDVIATIACRVAHSGNHATIISTDTGFMQLHSDLIHLFDYFNRRDIDNQWIEQKFNVKPHQLVNYWSLVGSNSNNIPGVKGIGPGSATDIITNYPSLKAALESETLKPSIKKKLKDNIAEFKLCRQLLTLKTDIPLGINLKDLRVRT